LIDYPRKKYVDYGQTNGAEIFVSVHFKLHSKDINSLKILLKKKSPPTPAVAKEGEDGYTP
jgi:hypothetical protein